MIAFLSGEIAEVGESSVTIDVGGVGYRVFAPTSVLSAMSPGKSGVTIHTSMVTVDGTSSLYGFTTPEERDVFELLITVSGIGPKAGIKLMCLPKDRLLEAIVAEDVAILTTVQGVGPKTAKRVILELKDKITQLFQPGRSDVVAGLPEGGEIEVAAQGLKSLGYTPAEIRGMLKTITKDDLEKLPAASIIKLCLQKREQSPR
ncbi:MAG TPA: Holliday junction branch migration protein RuvA [bacterium]|nr:Holliday junction branch migration protein RuvA [bacterium]